MRILSAGPTQVGIENNNGNWKFKETKKNGFWNLISNLCSTWYVVWDVLYEIVSYFLSLHLSNATNLVVVNCLLCSLLSVKLVEQELWQREEKGLIGIVPVRDAAESASVGPVLYPGVSYGSFISCHTLIY